MENKEIEVVSSTLLNLVEKFNNCENDTDRYNVLTDIRDLSLVKAREISHTGEVPNIAIASTYMAEDACEYLNKYMKDNHINIHAQFATTPTRANTKHLTFRPDYDSKKYVRHYCHITYFINNFRKKLVFDVIGEEYDTMMTKKQLEKFMEVREAKGISYLDSIDVIQQIVNAINSVELKEQK